MYLALRVALLRLLSDGGIVLDRSDKQMRTMDATRIRFIIVIVGWDLLWTTSEHYIIYVWACEFGRCGGSGLCRIFPLSSGVYV